MTPQYLYGLYQYCSLKRFSFLYKKSKSDWRTKVMNAIHFISIIIGLQKIIQTHKWEEVSLSILIWSALEMSEVSNKMFIFSWECDWKVCVWYLVFEFPLAHVCQHCHFKLQLYNNSYFHAENSTKGKYSVLSLVDMPHDVRT